MLRLVSFLLGFACLLLALPTVVVAQSASDVDASKGEHVSHVYVSWEAAEGEPAQWAIFRSGPGVNRQCEGSPIKLVAGGERSYRDTAVPGGEIYYYSLLPWPVNGAKCSNSAAGFRGFLPPPFPPVDVQATETLEDRITLAWRRPEGSQPIDSYQIFRHRGSQAYCLPSDLIATVGGTDESYDDFAATANETYFYTMRSLGPTGSSGQGACSAPPAARGYRVLPPPPLPPINVQASDGLFGDRIVVSWEEPIGSREISTYSLYRSLEPSSGGCRELLIAGLGAQDLEYVDTANIISGQDYYYSLRSFGPSGESLTCSNVDPGFAAVGPVTDIDASDGESADRVEVVWSKPVGGGIIEGYRLFRSSEDEACRASDLIQQELITELEFLDLTVVPNQTYNYSIEVVYRGGVSDCRADTGFAITACADGADNDGDFLADFPLDPGCESPLDNDEFNEEVCEENCAPEPPITPTPTPTPEEPKEEDPPPSKCSDGEDNDGDGLVDFPSDPGCDSADDDDETDEPECLENCGEEPLRSPAFAKWNTFLGQWNFAELVNQGEQAKSVLLVVYNLHGNKMIEREVVVPAGEQVDVDINALVVFACDVLESGCEDFEDLSETQSAPNGLGHPDGVVDTYGLVGFEFDESDGRLLGRVSTYRPNADDSFSFALARELKNASKGTSFALTNTHDPRGRGYLVPNWVEVIAFGKRNRDGLLEYGPQSFTVNYYSQEGALIDSTRVNLGPLSEFDVHGGHEFVDSDSQVVESVYLVEVIPDEPDYEYFLSVARYSSNAEPGQQPETYNFAFVARGDSGSVERLHAPISNTLRSVAGLGESVAVTNWVEIGCVSEEECRGSVEFRDQDGRVVDRQIVVVAPKAQLHLNSGALINKRSSGVVVVTAESGRVILQSMSYVHGAGSELQSGFISQGRNAGRAEQVGTLNTFLGMQNIVELYSTAESGVDVSYRFVLSSAGEVSGITALGGGGAVSIGVNSAGTFSVGPNNYGSVSFDFGDEGVGQASVYRVRLDANGEVDFVMHTAVE